MMLIEKLFKNITKLSGISGASRKQSALTIVLSSLRRSSMSATAKFLQLKHQGSVYASTLTVALAGKFSRCAMKLSGISGASRKQRKLAVASEAGETIVEVMMSAAIMGLVIVSAYVLVNRGLTMGRQAKERTQVLKIVESQLERLKYLATQDSTTSTDIFGQTGDFCVAVATDGTMTLTSDTGSSACDHGNFPRSGLTVVVHYDPNGATSSVYDDNTFTVTASWDRANGILGDRDNVTIRYRLHPPVTPLANAPLVPPPDCGSALDFNLTEVRKSSTDKSNHPNNDPWFKNRKDLHSLSESSPDFDLRGLNGKINSSPRCSYSVSAVSFCRNYVAVGDSNRRYNTCGDQSNERARVEFYDTYDPVTESCTGNLVGYFDTDDTDYDKKQTSGPPPRLLPWPTEDKTLQIVRDGNINCMQLRHICLVTMPPASGWLRGCWRYGPNSVTGRTEWYPRGQSSMYVERVGLKVN